MINFEKKQQKKYKNSEKLKKKNDKHLYIRPVWLKTVLCF